MSPPVRPPPSAPLPRRVPSTPPPAPAPGATPPPPPGDGYARREVPLDFAVPAGPPPAGPVAPADPAAARQLADARVQANLQTSRTPSGSGLGRDPALERQFLTGGRHLYSRNFGQLDPAHAGYNFNMYLDVHSKVEEAARTGRSQQIQLECGSGMRRIRMNYTIDPPPRLPNGQPDPEAMHRITRGIVADAGYRYEDHTQVFGGVGNRAAELAGRGTSAFSTEDLSSNGLGMMAGEAYVRAHGTANAPDREAATQEALRTILDRSGGIAARDPSGQVSERSFGNMGFVPVRSSAYPPEPGADAYLRQLERERVAGGTLAGRGPGWHLEGTEGSFVGNLVQDRVVDPIADQLRRLRHLQWDP